MQVNDKIPELNDKSEAEIKKAKNAHEIFIMNLIFGHLLIVPAIIVLDIGYIGLLIPVIFSTLLLLYYISHAKAMAGKSDWVASYWVQAIKYFRLLFISYAIVAVLLTLIGLLVSTHSILFVALSRVAIMPAIVMVFVTFVLASSVLGRAGKGEDL